MRRFFLLLLACACGRSALFEDAPPVDPAVSVGVAPPAWAEREVAPEPAPVIAPPGWKPWSKHFGSINYDEPSGVAADSQDNVVIIGKFFGQADFGGGVLKSAGSADFFLAKYDAFGRHLWSKHWGSTSLDFSSGLAIAPNDDLVICGWFAGTVDFGGATLTSRGFNDGFVARYSPDGALRWAKRFGGDSIDEGDAVAVRPTGEVVVSGTFRGAADFDGAQAVVASGTSDDAFVSEWAADGQLLHLRRFGTAATDTAPALGLTGGGDIVVAGSVGVGPVDFGLGPVSGHGEVDAFVATYGPGLQPRWAKRLGRGSTEVVLGLAVSPDSGAITLAGYFGSATTLGGPTLVSAGAGEAFVAQLDSSGGHRWSLGFGGREWDGCRGVALAPDGAATVLCSFEDRVVIGADTLISTGESDLALIKLSTQGQVLATRRLGSSGFDAGWALALDRQGRTLVTGTFDARLELGNGIVHDPTGQGDGDGFIASTVF